MIYEDLLSKLNTLRGLGKITAHFKLHEDILVVEEANLTHIIDSYVGSLGFHRINSEWTEISEVDAHNTLDYLITHSIAYGVELMFSKELREVVQEFVGLFSADCRYFTNGNWHKIAKMENNSSTAINPFWTPLSESVFDGGLVWVTEKQVGIVWIEEND